MFKYKNGNCVVTLLEDGTKIREYNENEIPSPIFPESIDLKITNYCDLHNVCLWCHEASDKKGNHSNIKDYFFLLEQLPSGAELAVGGGNPLSHPDIIPFLEKAKQEGVVVNMTVNELHLKRYKTLLTDLISKNLIHGLGISFKGSLLNEIEYFCDLTDNVVFHVITGVNKLSDLDIISKYSKKVLILGYKEFRKGKDFYDEEVENKKYQWYIRLPLYFSKMTLSFDNLAISELNLKRFFQDKEWNKFYMGNDGEFTMYIDAVNKKYARSSTNPETFDLTDNIKDMFSDIRDKYIK